MSLNNVQVQILKRLEKRLRTHPKSMLSKLYIYVCLNYLKEKYIHWDFLRMYSS